MTSSLFISVYHLTFKEKQEITIWIDFQINETRGDSMKKHIEEVLKRIELDYDVRILYACDAGSRSYGLASQGSDYDIRFIYVHRLEWYLSIDHGPDVIEIPERNFLSMPIDPLLDVRGWELSKALKLYRKSNPSLIEWLNSKKIFIQEQKIMSKVKSIQQEVLLPKALVMHYLNIANRNFNEGDIKKHEVKRYLYIIRSLLASSWIVEHKEVPPINFFDLVNLLSEGETKEAVLDLARRKKSGSEVKPEKLLMVDQFIIEERKRLELELKNLGGCTANPTEKLNQIFRDAIMEVWN
jgi:uncharacterized protein